MSDADNAGRHLAVTRTGDIAWADDAELAVRVTDRHVAAGETALTFHPPVLALGIGCERNCPADEIAALAEESLAAAGLAAGAVAAVVSVELKLGEPGIHALAEQLGVPARFFSAATRPKRSATTSQDPTMSCRPPAARALPPASGFSIF